MHVDEDGGWHDLLGTQLRHDVMERIGRGKFAGDSLAALSLYAYGNVGLLSFLRARYQLELSVVGESGKPENSVRVENAIVVSVDEKQKKNKKIVKILKLN